MNARDKLIEMIDEIDGVTASDTVIILDMIKYFPLRLVEQFVEDTIRIHELYPENESQIEIDWPPPQEEWV